MDTGPGRLPRPLTHPLSWSDLVSHSHYVHQECAADFLPDLLGRAAAHVAREAARLDGCR